LTSGNEEVGLSINQPVRNKYVNSKRTKILPQDLYETPKTAVYLVLKTLLDWKIIEKGSVVLESHSMALKRQNPFQ
jgi:hypothetical protein